MPLPAVRASVGVEVAPRMKRIFLAFFATGITQLTNFASGVLLARLLGPEFRGEVAQIIAWFGFIAPVALLGINDSVVFFSTRNPSRRGEVLASALRLMLITSGIGLVFAALVPLTVLADIHPVSIAAAWLFLLYVPLYQLQQILYANLQAGSRHGIWAWARCVPGLVYVGGLSALAVANAANAVTIIAANLAGLLAAAVLCLVANGSVDLRAPARGLRREMARYGLPLVWQRLAIVCRDNADRMVLPFFISAATLGHYVVASSVAYLIYIGGITIDLIGFPAMVREGDEERRRALADFLIAVTFWVLVAVAVLFALIRQTVVNTLFGPAFSDAATLVPYFLAAGALQAWRMVIGGAFKAFDRSSQLARVEMVGSIVMVVILITTAATLGPYAGVLAHLVSSIVAALIAYLMAARVLKLSLVHMIIPRPHDMRTTVDRIHAGFATRRKRQELR